MDQNVIIHDSLSTEKKCTFVYFGLLQSICLLFSHSQLTEANASLWNLHKKYLSLQETSSQQLLVVRIQLDTSSSVIRVFNLSITKNKHSKLYFCYSRVAYVFQLCLEDGFRRLTCCFWLCLPPIALLIGSLWFRQLACWMFCQKMWGCTKQHPTESQRVIQTQT